MGTGNAQTPISGSWSTGSTFTASITATTGNVLVLGVAVDANNSSNTVNGVADGSGNTYNEIDRQENVVLGGNVVLVTYYAKVATGGALTITATLNSSNVDWAMMFVHEVNGQDATTPLGVHMKNSQANPLTGADAITSTAVTATAGDYVFGMTMDSNHGDTYAHGSGFTDGINITGGASEYIANFAGGSKAGTFTATFGTVTYQTAVVMIKAAAAANIFPRFVGEPSKYAGLGGMAG